MKTILLIDDDPNEHNLFAYYLRKTLGQECRLDVATSLDEGVAALSGSAYDAIFLDNRLKPHADFRETLPAVLAHSKDARTYIISASVDDDCFDQAEEFPIAGVLDKFDIRKSLEAGLLN